MPGLGDDLKELQGFSLNEYAGIKSDDTIDDSMRAPTYGTVASYPDSLVVGGTLFPMLYLYYYGDTQNKNKIGDKSLFDKGINAFFQQMQDTMSGGSHQSGDANSAQILQNNMRKFYKMFISAVNKNRNWLFTLSNATTQLMTRFRTRLPTGGGNYYSNSSRTQFSNFPIMEGQNTSNLEAVMETLRILFENGMITHNQELGIHPLDLYTGDLAGEDPQLSQLGDMARVLGLPTRGVFTVNNRLRTDFMFKTFSGIDIIALSSLNTIVSRLEGLTQISWSIHKGKNPQRVIGKPTSPGRASGSRTIAGTMVFTLSDHHPLLDLVPGDYPVTNTGALESTPELWQPIMMPDQLPPFDLMVIMTNEYGYASMVSLYGIEIIDEGTVISVDNLITECVVQYTAVAMDPITSVRTNENGDIDPYGILQGGYSRMWKHREAVVQGTVYSDLEVAYESQYDETFSLLQRKVSKARNEAIRRREEKENVDQNTAP